MDPIIVKYPSRFHVKKRDKAKSLSIFQKCKECGCKLHITSLQQLTCSSGSIMPYKYYPNDDDSEYWHYSCPYCNIEEGISTSYPMSKKNVIKIIDYIKRTDHISILDLMSYYNIITTADGFLDHRPDETYRIICLCNKLKFDIPEKVILSKHFDIIAQNIESGVLDPNCIEPVDCEEAIEKLPEFQNYNNHENDNNEKGNSKNTAHLNLITSIRRMNIVKNLISKEISKEKEEE